MTLPRSGSISMGQIAAELGIGMPLALHDPRVLALAGKSAPPVTMPNDFYGKSNAPPPPTSVPLTVTKTDGNAGAVSRTSGGTLTCNPSVSESGGTAPYTRLWSFTSNPNGCALSNETQTACTVSKTYAKSSSGVAEATLRCVTTDSVGAQVITDNIDAYLEWTGDA